MEYKFLHEAYNVADVDVSVKFYEEALGLKVQKRIDNADCHIALMVDEFSPFILELAALTSHPQKYDLGECEFHLAFGVNDFDAAYKKHKEMGCVCMENLDGGFYFIEDPDGYWLEIGPDPDNA